MAIPIKKNMLKLETIQNMALRLALGLYPHTSSDRTRKLAGVVPISERIAKATVKYYTRIQSYGEQHPIFTLCIGSARQQNKIGIASWQAFSALCPNWSLDKIQVDSFKFPPPWKFCQPNVSLKLIQDKKENIPHQLIRAEFLRKKATEFKDHLHIYTDGSLVGNKSAAAAVIPQTSLSIQKPLQRNSSVLTAELAAIVESLGAIKNIPLHFSKVAIFSDSQTALKLMKTLTWNAKDTDLQEIREQLDSLYKIDIAVAFQHIPSHVGIHYNEKVDILAAETAKSINPQLAQNYSIALRDAIRNRHPYRKPPPALAPIFKEPEINRAYFKIKSLAVILRREEFRWKQYSDPNCRLCNLTEETLQHLLFECTASTPGIYKLHTLSQNFKLPLDINLIVDAPLPASIEKKFYREAIDVLMNLDVL